MSVSRRTFLKAGSVAPLAAWPSAPAAQPEVRPGAVSSAFDPWVEVHAANVRHNVADESFSLYKSDDREYTDPQLSGHGQIRSGRVKLDLKRTRIKRLDTQRLRLDLALTFSRHAAGKRYRVAVQADDLDGRNQIERLGRLRIKR